MLKLRSSPNRQRLAFLRLLYKKSGGSRSVSFDLGDLRREMGVSKGEAVKIADYLKNEGLIEASLKSDRLGITHRGIKYVEQRRYPWGGWNLHHLPRFLILALISWGIGQLLNREVLPLLFNGSPPLRLGAGLGGEQHVQPTATLTTATPPVWQTQLVAFVIAIPLVYIAFSLVFHDGHLRADLKSLAGAVIFSAAGIFVFSLFI